jgi:hypothetical protein
MGRSADARLGRLLVGSPLRKRRVAIPVIFALVAAILVSTTLIFAAVGSLKAEAAKLFTIGLLFSRRFRSFRCSSYGILIGGSASRFGSLPSPSYGER